MYGYLVRTNQKQSMLRKFYFLFIYIVCIIFKINTFVAVYYKSIYPGLFTELNLLVFSIIYYRLLLTVGRLVDTK